MISELRYCKSCKLDKPISEFGRHKRDGYQSQCKTCKARYFQNFEKTRRQSETVRAARARKIEEKEELRRCGLKRCISCKEAKPIDNFAKHRRRKDGHQSTCRNCEAEANDIITIIKKQEIARHKKYNEKKPEVNRTSCRNRNARKKQAGGRHTEADILSLFEAQCGKCAHPWCRKSLKKGYHVDHRVALARGGSNDRKNLQLLCPHCNIRKHAKDPIDFAQENGMLL